MFIQTEATPNPATLKFLPGRTVSDVGAIEFTSATDAGMSPLAEALFAIDGVSGVMFGLDFVSVTKEAGEWQHLKPSILGALMEHFMSDRDLFVGDVEGGAISEEEFFAPEDAETVEAIKDLLETRVRPAVAGDGGDITFRGFRDGVVYLSMRGACAGCPSSTATLKHGIQNLLRHFVPEVREVEQINA
ncbi:MAG: NifU family protein [Beijerinckiaceae bacterium]